LLGAIGCLGCADQRPRSDAAPWWCVAGAWWCAFDRVFARVCMPCTCFVIARRLSLLLHLQARGRGHACVHTSPAASIESVTRKTDALTRSTHTHRITLLRRSWGGDTCGHGQFPLTRTRMTPSCAHAWHHITRSTTREGERPTWSLCTAVFDTEKRVSTPREFPCQPTYPPQPAPSPHAQACVCVQLQNMLMSRTDDTLAGSIQRPDGARPWAPPPPHTHVCVCVYMRTRFARTHTHRGHRHPIDGE
jgi:hypothetical protein